MAANKYYMAVQIGWAKLRDAPCKVLVKTVFILSKFYILIVSSVEQENDWSETWPERHGCSDISHFTLLSLMPPVEFSCFWFQIA